MRVPRHKYIKCAELLFRGMTQKEAVLKSGITKSTANASKICRNPVVQDRLNELHAAKEEIIVKEEAMLKDEKLLQTKGIAEKAYEIANNLMATILEKQRNGQPLNADDKMIMGFLDKTVKMWNTAGVRDDSLQGHTVSEEENPQNVENRIYENFFLNAQKSDWGQLKDAEKVENHDFLLDNTETVIDVHSDAGDPTE